MHPFIESTDILDDPSALRKRLRKVGYLFVRDLLMFTPLTIHAAAENHTPDRLRISIDFRYAGESHTISEGWLQPHYNWLGDKFSWDALDKEWRDSSTARYWERLPNVKARPRQQMPGS